MASVYGVVEKIANNVVQKDCQAIYDLLSTDAGMKKCRELLRDLGNVATSGAKLAEQLIDAESKMGFGKYARLRGEAFHPHAFLDLLVAKYALIDEAAGDDHGTNTHRLQWWLVYKAWEKGKAWLDLTHKPGDLYIEIGKQRMTSGRYYVWDDLFDHAPDSVDLLNRKKPTFGRPEYFCNQWLRGKKTASKGKASDQVYQNLGKAFAELETMAAKDICKGTLEEKP